MEGLVLLIMAAHALVTITTGKVLTSLAWSPHGQQQSQHMGSSSYHQDFSSSGEC